MSPVDSYSFQKQGLAVLLAIMEASIMEGEHYGRIHTISVELLKILQNSLLALGVSDVGDLWIFESSGGFSWRPSCPR